MMTHLAPSKNIPIDSNILDNVVSSTGSSAVGVSGLDACRLVVDGLRTSREP